MSKLQNQPGHISFALTKPVDSAWLCPPQVPQEAFTQSCGHSHTILNLQTWARTYILCASQDLGSGQPDPTLPTTSPVPKLTLCSTTRALSQNGNP